MPSRRCWTTAAEESLSGLRDKCGRVKAAADRDPEATNRRIHAERYLRYGKGTDGAVNGSFRLTPQAGAKLDAFLQPFIQAQARKAKAERRRDTLDQLSADALVAMAEAAVHGPAAKTTRPQVNVIVDRDALLRGHTEGEERCEFSTCFGPVPVPVSVVQEILDDAFLVGLFHDGVDVQAAIRFGRHTAAAVKDALRVRDDFTCSAKGCNRRARLEIDHTEPVAAGGPTRYTNLKHLCWYHHQQKTKRDRQRARAALSRTGRTVTAEVTRLIGVYDADGTVLGELSYFLRARVGRAHCALCDITHGRVRERDDWRAERDRLPVPFTTFHRDDQPDGGPLPLPAVRSRRPRRDG